MKNRIILILVSILFIGNCVYGKVVNNPKAVCDMLERIGGDGASKLICTQLDTSIDGELFIITAKSEKPCIKASTLSALTCGIGWYLNHYANVNLSWNCPSVDLSKVALPVPQAEDSHACSVDYRYYLNYCTFSYSMSTWTWQRWQQEIDWMALHGVNMPLQIVGLETVWRNMLREEYGYSDEEINRFIAGPCFMAWFGMNNLEGWGGPNPQWWYVRQERLCRKINERMRSLGIEPVLPGYSGMVPSDFSDKTGIASIDQGKWCSFSRPHILDPNAADFGEVAKKYYKHLHRVMGSSKYYSMDPFHEGANTSHIDVDAAYANIYGQMAKANKQAKWVIQQWQWSRDQYKVLNNVPKGKLIVLDLYSDGRPNLGAYGDHDVVYCIIPNFGGRTGTMGRFDKVMNEFFDAKAKLNTIRGIGAAPESIEQVPVLYDALFELPWMSEKPDAAKWVEDYTVRRYGARNDMAIDAWQLMRTTVLNCPSALQGPQEAVTCARPSWHVDRVSTWGGTKLFYEPTATAQAASLLLKANLSGQNYTHDLLDFTRQALTDYAYTLLQEIYAAHEQGDNAKLTELEHEYLALIADIDQLLSTNHNFMLGKWVKMARDIAEEEPGTTSADKEWLQKNALTLITTWGERENSEKSGLHDYSYRQWGGMLKDYYGMRWQKFFTAAAEESQIDWYQIEREWVISGNKIIATPEGDAKEIATTLMHRYFKLN